MRLPRELAARVESIASDRLSGATALTLQGLAILREVAPDRRLAPAAALALCRAQPSMAGFHTMAAMVAAADDASRELALLAERMRRAPASIARYATQLLQLRRSDTSPIRLLTHSRSALVERSILDLGRTGPVRVACSESRPGLEGRGLATALAASGVDVELYTDAGLGAAMPGADAFLVGADGVSSDIFINKVGTAALSALARTCGVPVFVLAGVERILPRAVLSALLLFEGPSDEVDASPGSIRTRNPYFERVPADVAAQLVTDRGAIAMHEAEGASLWTAASIAKYLRLVDAYNMLDNS